jgi:hypothetical protein
MFAMPPHPALRLAKPAYRLGGVASTVGLSKDRTRPLQKLGYDASGS